MPFQNHQWDNAFLIDAKLSSSKTSGRKPRISAIFLISGASRGQNWAEIFQNRMISEHIFLHNDNDNNGVES